MTKWNVTILRDGMADYVFRYESSGLFSYKDLEQYIRENIPEITQHYGIKIQQAEKGMSDVKKMVISIIGGTILGFTLMGTIYTCAGRNDTDFDQQQSIIAGQTEAALNTSRELTTTVGEIISTLERVAGSMEKIDRSIEQLAVDNRSVIDLLETGAGQSAELGSTISDGIGTTQNIRDLSIEFGDIVAENDQILRELQSHTESD